MASIDHSDQSSTLLGGQSEGSYYPGNFYGGTDCLYGGYPGYYNDYKNYGGFGFNPLFFANNNDLNADNFRANQFDHNINIAVFNNDIHKKKVDANSVIKNSNTNFQHLNELQFLCLINILTIINISMVIMN
ncbi:hypothetical protein CONCODRAFT_167088 [Conidiobolus coronatus NRRL 28638]|uniref:Uncharacterized protein n=1 Tax=Conidiobolus coronatus (strain ATCC 28846 / CBS 209.66 / NRRL 28638) TaxID=796925 RepID=A0A137NYY5_CONC2|nr:hypothetical protein CONCODRAFT_167088 [Conidiobolus coronatus NRRL 28638]|eukprot:KXN67819.1 hypothetical protein CONCODRAFT_167088 [Conidiobolus coronatus NRRL 28638]